MTEAEMMDEYIDALEKALKPLAAIADEYEDNALDEARPEWFENGARQPPTSWADIELLDGRGGKRLLTLADAFAARVALGGVVPPIPGSIVDPRCFALRTGLAVTESRLRPRWQEAHVRHCDCKEEA